MRPITITDHYSICILNVISMLEGVPPEVCLADLIDAEAIGAYEALQDELFRPGRCRPQEMAELMAKLKK